MYRRPISAYAPTEMGGPDKLPGANDFRLFTTPGRSQVSNARWAGRPAVSPPPGAPLKGRLEGGNYAGRLSYGVFGGGRHFLKGRRWRFAGRRPARCFPTSRRLRRPATAPRQKRREEIGPDGADGGRRRIPDKAGRASPDWQNKEKRQEAINAPLETRPTT